MIRICVIGGGQMGSALLGGLVASGTGPASDYAVAEPRTELRAQLEQRFPGVVMLASPAPADGAILAMKPADVAAACQALEPDSYAHLLSIAAGVTLSSLESWLWPGARVIRAMPNTPALLGAGATAIVPGNAATADDLEWADRVLSSVGIVVRLDERSLDAVTGLSGSGPAYVFYLAEMLIAAGVDVGLDGEVARRLTTQTLLGAARMLAETGQSPAELRAAVTSPNGTTAAAIAALERHGLRDAVVDAVRSAVARSIELGQLST